MCGKSPCHDLRVGIRHALTICEALPGGDAGLAQTPKDANPGCAAFSLPHISQGFAGGSDGKGSACSVVYLVSIPVLGRSPRGGHGYPLQYSYLENLHGQRSLAGHSPWGGKESDTNKGLSTRVSASPSSWPPKGQGQEGGEETRGAWSRTCPDLARPWLSLGGVDRGWGARALLPAGVPN